MTAPGVHDYEMPAPQYPDERAMDAFLAGRSAAGAEGPLGGFAEDLRVVVSGPAPAPAPALAVLLAEGFSVDEGDLPATAAPNPTGPVPRTARPSNRRRRKMTISELLAALAAKLTGLGMATKAALGLAVAAASVTGAGAAGVLPGPAQHAVAGVVNATTPLNLPDTTAIQNGDVTKAVTDVTGSSVPTVGSVTGVSDNPSESTGDAVGTTDQGSTQPADSHGACVSAVAKTAPTGAGGVHGRAVSAAAKSCPKPTDSGDQTGSTTTTSTSTTVPVVGGVAGTATPSAQSGEGHGQSGSHGGSHGNSGQHGR